MVLLVYGRLVYVNNKLIEKLSSLKLAESAIKRNLDRNYYNLKLRSKLFKELKQIQNEIERVKFKIRLEKEKKNDIKY